MKRRPTTTLSDGQRNRQQTSSETYLGCFVVMLEALKAPDRREVEARSRQAALIASRRPASLPSLARQQGGLRVDYQAVIGFVALIHANGSSLTRPQ